MSDCKGPLIFFTPRIGQLTHRMARISQLLAYVDRYGGAFCGLGFFDYLPLFAHQSEKLFLWHSKEPIEAYAKEFDAFLDVFEQLLEVPLQFEKTAAFVDAARIVKTRDLKKILSIKDPVVRSLLHSTAEHLIRMVQKNGAVEDIDILPPVDTYDVKLLTPELLTTQWKNKKIILWGDQRWFATDVTFKRFVPNLLKYFSPFPADLNAANECISRLRTNSDIVIGVHIRRGDYEQWRGGRFFYPLTQYAHSMNQWRALFPAQKVSFLIASNEYTEPTEFAGINSAFAPGHIIKDLLALSMCDYIIGPPSGYSQWASLVGRVPLYTMMDDKTVPTLEALHRIYDWDNPFLHEDRYFLIDAPVAT